MKINQCIKHVILFLLIGITLLARGREQDPLEYEVEVQAKIVPVFAVDTAENPVYDLMAEELQLYVNGKPCRIELFSRYGFEYNDPVTGDNGGEAASAAMVRNPVRYVFIIIDSIFNSHAGLKRSKTLAAGLIEHASPGDSFFILENNSETGLKYITGPTKNKNELLETLNQVKQHPVIRKKLNTPRVPSVYRSSSGGNENIEAGYIPGAAQRIMNAEKLRYLSDMKSFTRVLVDLKYALRTMVRPKIVFLISEGISNAAFKEEFGRDRKPNANLGSIDIGGREFNTQAFYFTYLKKIAESFNQGGAVIYSINPRRIDVSDDNDSAGDDSLKYLAAQSGGKYFRGLDVPHIINRVKKSTAAYYELFFYPETGTADKMLFNIACERKGVRIHTINFSEKDRPYRFMPKVQKKLFAFNMVTGGTWSRMTATIDKLEYKKPGTRKKDGKTAGNIEVILPGHMRGRVLDIFVLNIDPATMQSDIDLTRRTAGDSITIPVPIVKDKKPFVAIIEPKNVQCIYNIIKI